MADTDFYKAEIERLKKALDQAIDCAGLSVETVVKAGGE